jgi:protein disulfide-isomerase
MRWTTFLLGAAALVAAAPPQEVVQDDLEDSTYFNQQLVPPLVEIGPETWEDETKASKYLLVKHFR